MATGVDAKLLKSTKFPPEFNQKVDMTKVNLQVMKKYVRSHSSSRVPSHSR
jgi:serine/arginine repetitive matrix protein 1